MDLQLQYFVRPCYLQHGPSAACLQCSKAACTSAKLNKFSGKSETIANNSGLDSTLGQQPIDDGVEGIDLLWKTWLCQKDEIFMGNFE
jgi:hypothetical protein